MPAPAPMADRAEVVPASSHGLLFPDVPAMVAQDGASFVLLDATGARWQVTGPLCREIDASLAARSPSAGLRRLGAAHPALERLVAWLATPAVPLSREHAVRLDGFDTIF